MNYLHRIIKDLLSCVENLERQNRMLEEECKALRDHINELQ